MIWVDDVVHWGEENDLLNTLDLELGRLENVGMFVAAHKCAFFDKSITWCGKKVYSQRQVQHDPDRLSGFANMRRPATAGELTQLLQAVNWLRTSPPRMAEVVWPLRVLLEELMTEAKSRTKRG